MIQTIDITAGPAGAKAFSEPGDFFRYLDGPNPITVVFYRGGSEVSRADVVKAGYAETFTRGDFDRIVITSATAQTIQFVTRYGATVEYDIAPTGAVTLSGLQVSMTQALMVLSTGSISIAAAKSNRSYLLIQNKDTVNAAYVTVNGGAATVVNGIRIMPGGSMEFDRVCPTASINACTATGVVSVVVVEG